jgi:hypothetical protein
MSGFGVVSGNGTMNTYPAYNLVAVYDSLIGFLAIIIFLAVLALVPKFIRRLIVGYCVFVSVGLGLIILYVIVNSAYPIGRWLWFDVFSWVGKVVIDYGIYILISLPLAYLAGGWVDKKLFEEPKKKVKNRDDGKREQG